ncbi:transcriptional regulator, TetR family [Bacillus sp. JCM 19046]|nr:transcriptional regulator, TetR family [Bacillus sp. JCM 19045]GAF18206.1 transcriptional regulator, TetR family [Bacillus sp. JCM 19046]
MHTKEKIRLESTELFANLGYEGTSMAKIAEKVGIKKPSLYAHYKNKEALFFDVVDEMEQEYEAFVQDSLNQETDTIEERLYLSFKTHVSDLARDDASIQFYNRFIQYPPKELEDRLLARFNKSEERVRVLLAAVIEKGQAEGSINRELEAKSMAYTYFCLIEGLTTEVGIHSIEEVKAHAEAVWTVYWRGIQA